MSAVYDLRVEPWIPVRVGGASVNVGLRELFVRAHEVEDLALTIPPAAAGLWRILLALTYRITGLDDPDAAASDWYGRRHQLFDLGRFEPVEVDRWLVDGRFDLFHPTRPWFQDPRLAVQCAARSGVNKFVFARPSGNNPVWFGHFNDVSPVPLPAAEAVWHLIAQSFYGASGRCTSRVVDGCAEANTTAGPLRSLVSYHPIGRNLFESLLCGLVSPGNAVVRESSVADAAPWEEDLPDPLGPVPLPTWPCRMLVGRSRHAMLLVPSADGRSVVDAYLTWATRGTEVEVIDPYTIRRLSKDGRLYGGRADANRALWRDIDSLLREQPDDRDAGRPTVVHDLRGYGTIPDVLGAVRFRAFGFDQDGQVNNTQWFTATTPPILRYLDEVQSDALGWFTELRSAAETYAAVLRSALAEAWRAANAPVNAGGAAKKLPPGPWAGRAVEYFWSHAERAFWQAAQGGRDGSGYEVFRPVALAAVSFAVGEMEQSLRVARSIVQVRRRVAGVGKSQGKRPGRAA